MFDKYLIHDSINPLTIGVLGFWGFGVREFRVSEFRVQEFRA